MSDSIRAAVEEKAGEAREFLTDLIRMESILRKRDRCCSFLPGQVCAGWM